MAIKKEEKAVKKEEVANKKTIQHEFRSDRVNEMMAKGWKAVKVRTEGNQIGMGDLTLMEKEA